VISEKDYFMGRDAAYPDQLTGEIRINVAKLIPRVNAIIAMMSRDGVEPGQDTQTHTAVASGWRPALEPIRTTLAENSLKLIALRGLVENASDANDGDAPDTEAVLAAMDSLL
jgi:hypothetical protein